MKPRTTIAVFYYDDKDVMRHYEPQLKLEHKGVKLRDANRFNEDVREHCDAVYVAPDVFEELRERIAHYYSENFDTSVYFIEDEGVQEIDPADQVTEEIDVADDEENGPDLAEVEAGAARKHEEAEQATAKEAENAQREAQDAENQKTKIEMVTALKEKGVQIPRKSSLADIQKLYDDNLTDGDDLGLDD